MTKYLFLMAFVSNIAHASFAVSTRAVNFISTSANSQQARVDVISTSRGDNSFRIFNRCPKQVEVINNCKGAQFSYSSCNLLLNYVGDNQSFACQISIESRDGYARTVRVYGR
jgi:hypothetical protein